ncbi:hypothetical protein D3C81_1462660 [compost metagenome]
MVLAGGQCQHVLAVDQHDEAGFLALQEFLDHHARAGIAQLVVGQHHVDRGVGLFQRHRHHHALARGQAVGLDHDRRALRVDIGMRLGGVREGLVGGGRDAVALHERLGEVLGRFQLRSRLARPEDAQALGAEDIDDAGRQRCLRPDHGKGHAFALGKGGDDLRIGQRNVLQALVERGPAVARRHVHHLYLGGLGQFPGQRVFTSTRADNQYFHDPLPEKKQILKGGGLVCVRVAAMGGLLLQLSLRSPRW